MSRITVSLDQILDLGCCCGVVSWSNILQIIPTKFNNSRISGETEHFNRVVSVHWNYSSSVYFKNQFRNYNSKLQLESLRSQLNSIFNSWPQIWIIYFGYICSVWVIQVDSMSYLIHSYHFQKIVTKILKIVKLNL